MSIFAPPTPWPPRVNRPVTVTCEFFVGEGLSTLAVARYCPPGCGTGTVSAVGGGFYGCAGNGPAALEYDGANWIERSDQMPAESPDDLLYDVVLAPGGTEGWAVGEANSETGQLLVHLTGGR